jgi:hypothetical protein
MKFLYWPGVKFTKPLQQTFKDYCNFRSWNLVILKLIQNAFFEAEHWRFMFPTMKIIIHIFLCIIGFLNPPKSYKNLQKFAQEVLCISSNWFQIGCRSGLTMLLWLRPEILWNAIRQFNLVRQKNDLIQKS